MSEEEKGAAGADLDVVAMGLVSQIRERAHVYHPGRLGLGKILRNIAENGASQSDIDDLTIMLELLFSGKASS